MEKILQSTFTKIAFTLVLLNLASITNVLAALNGLTYTINAGAGASASNYTTWASALSDLQSGTRADGGPVNGPGVSGPVKFTVIGAWTVTAPNAIIIPYIATASFVNTITFDGQNTSSITSSTFNAANIAIVELKQCQWITFKNFNITNSVAVPNASISILLYGTGTGAGATCDNNTVQGNVINYTLSGSSAAQNAAISFIGSETTVGTAGWFNNNIIDGNTVSGGTNSTFGINGFGTAGFSVNNILRNNIINNTPASTLGPRLGGITLSNFTAVKIRGNAITIFSNGTTGHSINLSACGNSASDYTEISGNKLQGFGGSIGNFAAINFTGSANGGTAAFRTRVFNNFITFGNTSNTGLFGINLAIGQAYTDIYFNSIYLDHIKVAGGACLNVPSSCTNINVENNIFVYAKASGTGFPVICSNTCTPAGGVNFDYNVYYNTVVPANIFSYVGTANYTDGSSGTSVIGANTWNTHSTVGSANYLTLTPFATGPYDLHITALPFPVTTGTACIRGVAKASVTTDIDGQTRSLTAPNVGADELIVSVSPPTTTMASGGSQALTAASTAPFSATSYNWAPNTALTATTGTSVTANPTLTTTYTVFGKDANGCTAAEANAVINITVSNTPVGVAITQNPAGTVCVGTNVTFTAVPTNGGPGPTFQWDLNSVPISGATNSTYSTSSLANGDVIGVTMVSNSSTILGSNTASTTITVTVNSVIPTVFATPNPAAICGSGATIVASGATTYTWAPNTGLNTTAGQTVTANPGVSTTYTLTGTTNGCSASIVVLGTKYVTGLNGIYTIDKTIPASSTNFTSFGSAVGALICAGVSGPVTFNVGAGTYSEQVVVPAISGASSTNTITFDGGTGNAATRILTFAGTTGKPATWQFNECKWVAVKNITITNTSFFTVVVTKVSFGVQFYGTTSGTSCDNNTVQNCIINAFASTSNADACSGVIFNASLNQTTSGGFFLNNTVDGCTINNGTYSVRGTGTIGFSSGNRILNNTFVNPWFYQIYLNANFTGVKIIGNSGSSNSTYIGNAGYSIFFCNSSATDFTEISNNKITTFNSFGMFITGCHGTSASVNRTRIYNNFIGGGLSSLAGSISGLTGIQIANNDNAGSGNGNNDFADVWFNTININNQNAAAANTYGLHLNPVNGSLSDINVRNNILAFTPAGGVGNIFPFFASTTNPVTISALDYNIFYNATSNTIASIAGTAYNNSTVIGGGGFNSNSVVTNPNFDNVALTGYSHVVSQCARGVNIAAITTDIDGGARANPPSIGADEIVATGPGVPGTITGTASVCAGTSGVAFSVAAISLATGYNWVLPAGATIATGANTNSITVDFSSSAVSGTITVNGTNVACGNGPSSPAFTLTIKSLPPLTVTPPNAVCLGTVSTILTASGASTYTWAPNTDISATTGSVVTVQISNLSFYTVTGTGANGCTASAIIPVATVATGGSISPTYSIICSGGTKLLTVTGAAGHDYQWQISSDNLSWAPIVGATNTSYTTTVGNGASKKYYRLISESNACWNVASNTAVVDVSVSSITVTVTAKTDNSVTLDWTPVGSGNYTVSWSGTTSGSQLNITPPKTITGLTANGTYTFTVTQTGSGLTGCPASGLVSGVVTLCSVPTAVNAIAPGSSLISVTWTGPVANYRVFYRPLFSATSYAFKDVTTNSATITKYGANNISGGTTYEIYVVRLDCPNTGNLGQPSTKVYVTTPPANGCAAPVIDSVKSICPVQIEVWVHGAASNQYQIYLQRLTPTVQAVNSYPITGGHFSINIGSPGQTYLIAAASKCGSPALSNLVIWPGNLTVKPICDGVTNLVLSNQICKGFSASWNADQCLSNSASYYQLYIRQVGTVVWNSYPVTVPVSPIGPFKKITWLDKARTYEVYVKAVYNCNGFVTFGQASQIQTISTLSAGCKVDEEETIMEEQPVSRQFSANNDEVVSLYPNPNNGMFAIDISRVSNEDSEVRIEVINMLGQVVTTHLTSISNGHLGEFISLPNSTPAGNYFVKVSVGDHSYTTKMNISR